MDLERFAEIIGDKNAGAITQMATRLDLSVDQRMKEIVKIDPRFEGKDSPEWAVLTWSLVSRCATNPDLEDIPAQQNAG